MSNKVKIHRKGNPIANHPLMRKGGVHKKTRTSKRQQQKREMYKLVAKYRGVTRHRRVSVAKRASSQSNVSKMGSKRRGARCFTDDFCDKKKPVLHFLIATMSSVLSMPLI